MGDVIKISGLSKTFSLGFLGAVPGLGGLSGRLQMKGIAHRVEAVKSLTLSVPQGEIYGFLGPNGAGKTTTLKMLMGLVRPSGGEASLLGHPIGDRDTRASIGYLPEHPYFYEHLRPEEFLHFYGRLYGIPNRTLKARATELVERVGLGHARTRTLRKFSKGMVQRLGLAQALINDPELVILDEPMSGLDPMGRKTVRDLIFALKDKGKTVFFSSHILQDVEMVCDRVGILQNGSLIKEGRLSELLHDAAGSVEIVCANLSSEQAAQLAEFSVVVRKRGTQQIIELANAESQSGLLHKLVSLGVEILSVLPIKRSLEEIFVEEAGKRVEST